MNVEDYLAAMLHDHGVRRFFGIPGGPSIPYLESFRRAGIEFVLTSHEAAAAMMADVTARVTGVTGVCHATFGPGAVNLASGTGGAYLDRTPLLALTSAMPDAWRDRVTQMNIDHQGLFAPLTKASFRLTPANVAEVTGKALEISNMEYPGPVHIDLPSDIAGSKVPEVKGRRVAAPDHRKTGQSRRIQELIASAERPVIAAGLTAVRNRAGRGLSALLERCNVPVIVTPMAKGIIPADHLCFTGVLFHALSDSLRPLLRETDLVIGLGYDPVEYNYESWLPDVPLIHFDTIDTETGIENSIVATGDPDMWFENLSGIRCSDDLLDIARNVRRDISGRIGLLSSGFNPVSLLEVLVDNLPGEAILTADVGSHLHLLGQMWPSKSAGSLLMTNGWSSMGFGLPAAVATALAKPALPVVCITGDGGMMMYPGELLTARRIGVRIIVIVLADRELNLIRVKESWKNLHPYGVTLYNGSLFGADSFLGTRVLHAGDRDTFSTALMHALKSDESIIIEASVDPAVYNDLIVRS